MPRQLTVGVEEEYFAVEPRTRALLDDGRPVLRSARAMGAGEERYSEELRMCMLEGRTGICHDLAEVRSEVQDLRDVLIAAGRREGVEIAAAGTFPVAEWRALGFTPKPRYKQVAVTYARLAHEHVICACHVHVGVEGREAAIAVVNQVRPWLPVLLALSASSPFWMGQDTGYASYRSMVWERWPMAGLPPELRSYDHFRQTVALLIGAGISFDAGQVFWDVRPGTTYETVEFRIADACTTVDETMVQVGLSRALVRTLLDALARGEPGAAVDPVLLRAAKWRAARFGLGDTLLDPFAGTRVPAGSLVEQLLEYVRPALEEAGDWDEITAIIGRAAGSSSADRQRRAFARDGDAAGVAALLVQETAAR